MHLPAQSSRWSQRQGNARHPSRTRKLSLTAPMVLHPPGCGRVGHHRAHTTQSARNRQPAAPGQLHSYSRRVPQRTQGTGPPLPPPLTYHHQPPKNTNTADIFAHAPHPSEREPLRHLLALRVGSSQAFKNGKGTDGSPGSKVGPWRIRTVGTMRTTATRPGIVGTVTVTASVDASASMTGTTVLVAAITPVGAATRTMGGGVPRAASAMRAGPAQSTDGGMTGAQSAVGTEARTNGAQSAVITNLGVPTAAPEAEAPGRGRTSVEVARRSASASPSPVSPTTSNRATLSGAQRASFVPWDAPMPRTSPATW